MPEGHTIHRHARIQTGDLAGRALSVSSPQRWASEAAGAVDGHVLERVEAYGKHLFYRFADVRDALHVHLGLFGGFRRSPTATAPPPRPTTRLRMQTDERTVDLSGAIVSRLIDPIAEDELLTRLGPDPLRADADPERAWAALQRKRMPIGAALLDQRVIAGLGNVFRAEILFAQGIDPASPARGITREEFDALWKTTVDFLRRGERSGRIITVPAHEAGGRPSRLRGHDRHQVYRRESCRRCGTAISNAKVANRTLYWCEICQPS